MATDNVVTFKWLMGTALTLIAVSVSSYFGMSHIFSLALEQKVDIKVYARQIAYYDQELQELKEAQKLEQGQLNTMMINQATTIQKLDEVIRNWEKHISRSTSVPRNYTLPKFFSIDPKQTLPKAFYYLAPPPGMQKEKHLAMVREKDRGNPAGCLYSREGKTTLFSGFGLSRLLCD